MNRPYDTVSNVLHKGPYQTSYNLRTDKVLGTSCSLVLHNTNLKCAFIQ